MRRVLPTFAVLGLLVGMAQAQTVRIMGYGGSDPAVVQRLLDEVVGAQLAGEGITVQYEPIETDYNQVLTNALSAGTAADVFYIPGETAPGIIATGKVLPITDLVDTSPFIPSLMEVYTVDGEVYGIPKDFNTLAVFYNEDLFDEAGVEYPSADDDWNTFKEKLRAVNDLGDDVYGACIPADFARLGAFAYANGWTPFTEDGRVDLSDPAFVEAFEFYTGLVTEGLAVQPADIGAGWPGDCLAQERAGVAIEGAWIIGFLRDAAPNLPYGATLLPKSPTTGERGNFIYTVAWGVNADSPNRDAAVRVLEALTSPEAQQFILEEGLAIPSREALADNPYFQEESREAQGNLTVFQGASDGNVLGFQFGTVGTDYMGPLNNAATAVMTGQATVEEALAQAQQELDALLQRAGQ
ncbi:MAG TPA: ABC transporter substrate-binding protein [Trueperaceae bacterium]|nr:ABC transporter substrate-binding protein [Trueperaceae bacterium]